jgi:hypothetical protein
MQASQATRLALTLALAALTPRLTCHAPPRLLIIGTHGA